MCSHVCRCVYLYLCVWMCGCVCVRKCRAETEAGCPLLSSILCSERGSPAEGGVNGFGKTSQGATRGILLCYLLRVRLSRTRCYSWGFVWVLGNQTQDFLLVQLELYWLRHFSQFQFSYISQERRCLHPLQLDIPWLLDIHRRPAFSWRETTEA